MLDGACFSKVGPVAAIFDDPLLTTTSGTGMDSCAVPVCGPVGTYCYTSKASPFTRISTLQPLHAPAPLVAQEIGRAHV